MHRRRRVLGALTVAALVLVAIASHAQELIQLGEMSYSRTAAPHLSRPVTRTAGFFWDVGGVAFEAVASGNNNLGVRALRYDAAAADGDRLIVSVGRPDEATHTVLGRIYDWQLVPIARFANDENGSAMTLFGRLNDKKAQKEIQDAKDRVINYHRALDNTLVGLRLLHADILIIQQNAVHLFQNQAGILLGAGETGHDASKNRARFRQISEWQNEQERLGHKYQSYVVGDLDQRVTFAVHQGRIEFTGRPHWYAWRPKYDAPQDRATRNELITQHNQLVADHNALAQELNTQGVTMTPDERNQRRGRLGTMKASMESITKRLEKLKTVESMPEYSRSLSDKINALDGINPIVYRTLTAVMHYRALFRHYRGRDPKGFSDFVASLERVAVEPAVTTPTAQHRQRP